MGTIPTEGSPEEGSGCVHGRAPLDVRRRVGIGTSGMFVGLGLAQLTMGFLALKKGPLNFLNIIVGMAVKVNSDLSPWDFRVQRLVDSTR